MLGTDFLDSDVEIERAAAMTVPEIFETYGLVDLRASYPEVRARYFRETVFRDATEALANGLESLISKLRSGELAPDEQYAVRMVYRYQNEPTYQGANIKESEWLVPLSLFGQIDGPDYLYEWYVGVERLHDEGSGTPISPESERRTFTWR